jgi:hypothetical protein
MTAVSPPEAFPLAQQGHSRLPTLPLAVRVGNRAMLAGAAALVAGTLIEMSSGFVVANAPALFLVLDRLDAPLMGAGQLLLFGGAVAARMARRRLAREERLARRADDTKR